MLYNRCTRIVKCLVSFWFGFSCTFGLRWLRYRALYRKPSGRRLCPMTKYQPEYQSMYLQSVWLFPHYFRRHSSYRSQGGPIYLFLLDLLRKPQICDLINPIMRKYVLSFQIPMNDPMVMQFLNPTKLTAMPLISCLSINMASF